MMTTMMMDDDCTSQHATPPPNQTQQVAHEILALQVVEVLLGEPTDDSVEIAVAFVKEVGQLLEVRSSCARSRFLWPFPFPFSTSTLSLNRSTIR